MEERRRGAAGSKSTHSQLVVLSAGDRDDDVDAALEQAGDQRSGSRLGAHREVAGDAVDLRERGGEQVRGDRVGHHEPLLGRTLLAALQHLVPQRVLAHAPTIACAGEWIGPGAAEDDRRRGSAAGHRRVHLLLRPARGRSDRHDRRGGGGAAHRSGAGVRPRARRPRHRGGGVHGRDQAQRWARHVDGHGPRQVAAAGASRPHLPRHHRRAGAARAAHARRRAAAAVHEQLPHPRRHAGRTVAVRRPRGATGCRSTSCRTASPSCWPTT